VIEPVTAFNCICYLSRGIWLASLLRRESSGSVVRGKQKDNLDTDNIDELSSSVYRQALINKKRRARARKGQIINIKVKESIIKDEKLNR
jgi:hypothetical protein